MTRNRALASRRHRPLPAACPQVALNRFDLFHAHLFLPHGSGGGGSAALGLLFHAAEYPARCAAFPYHLGYCQANSTLEYKEKAMDLRNIVYYQARASGAGACAQCPGLAALERGRGAQYDSALVFCRCADACVRGVQQLGFRYGPERHS